MDFLIELLIDYGYFGMAVAAFLAGSVLPFSSEAVMVGLIAAGLDPWTLVIYASTGNILGGYFNYTIGRMGRIDWIEKYLHVKKEKLDKAERFMKGHGAWMGLLAATPVLGDVITIMLGLMRANLPISFISIALSKAIRYILLVYGTQLIFLR